MNVRLIKPGMSRADQKAKQPVDVPIVDTIRSWVREFQSTKSDRPLKDLQRISNAGKT